MGFSFENLGLGSIKTNVVVRVVIRGSVQLAIALTNRWFIP
ncbi:hypothetical protein [Calothrix sp. UHCC 0171]|nr:hypothetical protein [Calothrix sp. UHCC 0171]MEA5573506.1 hypothetical protein [Calothrix sp. UHCC 0171]